LPNDLPPEVTIARSLDHPHILRIDNCVDFVRNREPAFAVAMPFAEFGALHNSDLPQLTVTMCVDLLLQIGSALGHMHSQQIVHRDVKPDNILVFPHGFTLCDFSVSVVLSNEHDLLSDQIGTSVFMAPEISRHLYSPKPTDMWSLGITVFSLLYGMFPFNLSHFQDNPDIPAHIRVTDNVMPYDLVFPDAPVIPDELKTILSRLLDKDPERRLTAAELVLEEFLMDESEDWEFLVNGLRTQ
jgi:serine/threonine protein kinase